MENYISSLASGTCEKITQLSLITETNWPAAYFTFTAGYKHRFTFFTRTVKIILSSVQIVMKEKLMSTLFNDLQISDEWFKLQALFKLPTNLVVWELSIRWREEYTTSELNKN